MNKLFPTFLKIGALSLIVLSLNATAGNRFTMNGRSVQLVASGNATAKTKATSTDEGRITVLDVESGQVSVYTNGLIITLKDASTANAVVSDYPGLTLRYTTGRYAFARVSSATLATTFDALNSDPRVSAVHLRPLPVPAKPR